MENKSASPVFTEDVDNIKDTGVLFSVLVNIMKKLRSCSGCIWDREQTHESIKKNLVEEAYEALESIEDSNYSELKEELGDILLQVVFHSRIAEDNKEFEINDVIRAIIKKL
ncbi:MAG: nucleotide pyrophosphohydrolase, partial [Actinobacteria bacterium]|nr:nucleotide pyrophosphohydrolase [Actinomycetota bacterium]